MECLVPKSPSSKAFGKEPPFPQGLEESSCLWKPILLFSGGRNLWLFHWCKGPWWSNWTLGNNRHLDTCWTSRFCQGKCYNEVNGHFLSPNHCVCFQFCLWLNYWVQKVYSFCNKHTGRHPDSSSDCVWPPLHSMHPLWNLNHSKAGLRQLA